VPNPAGNSIRVSDLGVWTQPVQVTRLSGREEISRPFRYDIELAVQRNGRDDGKVKVEALLARSITVTLISAVGQERHINGVITEFAQVGFDERHHLYRAVIRPKLWLLTHSADCRIFQDAATTTIVAQVFRTAPIPISHQTALSKTYEPWEYRAQFDETDFDFVSRLLEHEGLYYYFDHGLRDHELMLADDVAKLTSTNGYAEVDYHEGLTHNQEFLSSWGLYDSVQPQNVSGREYDFEQPPNPSEAGSAVQNGNAGKLFEYPVRARKPSTIADILKVRAQQFESARSLFKGAGDAIGLAAGRLFKLKKHVRADFNKQYLIVATELNVSWPAYQTGSSNSATFSIAVEAVDATVHYRPLRRTPRPRIHGTQTAMVVGPSKKEIWTDKYGRIKVEFPWDRGNGSGGGGDPEPSASPSSSSSSSSSTSTSTRSSSGASAGNDEKQIGCWVRVAQSWAGKNWGAQYIPRVGQEVVVSFLDGDPDRPIVIGSVYSPQNMPPYALPDNAMQSGVKTQSGPEGDLGAANELRFEDKKGEEHLYLHAQKDMQVLVENNQTITVGGEKKDKGDRITTIANDDTLNVKHDCIVNVDNDRKATVKGKHVTTVEKDEERAVKGKRTTDVSGDDVATAANYTFTAKSSITFEVGPAKIVMKDGKIEISGVDITIKGNNGVTLDGAQTAVKGVQLDMSGKQVAVDGTAKLDISSSGVASLKGSLTRIG
jgi:type VI secretion system secreted protein VgrG